MSGRHAACLLRFGLLRVLSGSGLALAEQRRAEQRLGSFVSEARHLNLEPYTGVELWP